MGVAIDYVKILGLSALPSRKGDFDKVVAVVLECLGEPLEDRFVLIQGAIKKAESFFGSEWNNPAG